MTTVEAPWYVWPVTSGLVTSDEMLAIVKAHHRMVCSAFDGGKNQGMGAGPLNEDDRHHHATTIAGVIDALRSSGFRLERKSDLI